jgi:protein-disulfide isomerase
VVFVDEHHKAGENEGFYAVAISMIVSVLVLAGAMVYSVNGVNSNLQLMNANLANLQINIDGNIPTGQQLQGVPAPTQAPLPTQQLPPKPQGKIDLKNGVMKGSSSAKIFLVEYSDFQCPFCSRFYTQTLGSVLKDYVDTGKVGLVFKHFPLDSIHPNARPAAVASECAKDQGKFWEMHDIIFQNQNAINTADLKKYASGLKLDISKFNTCLDNAAAKNPIIDSQLQEGSQNGITGTPGFLLTDAEGNILSEITGAQPYAAFQQAFGSLNV